MRTREVKCYRCGNPIALDYRATGSTIHCRHCHGVMAITKKTENHFQFVKYLILMLMVILLVVGLGLLDVSYTALMLICIGATMLMTLYGDHFCLWVTNLLFGLDYVEYHPEQVAAREKEMARRREKAREAKKRARQEKKAQGREEAKK